MPLEIRTIGECRAIDDKEEGVFEGYAVTWGHTDSYNSQFKRGAFTKTLQERGAKLKVLANHNDDLLIGRVIEAREDDQGLFVRGKLTLGVQAARETYELLKDGALTALSFGFRTVNDMFERGTRVITEAALYEISPVPFPASEQAVVTSVRAEDFNETLEDDQLRRGGFQIMTALADTLDDIRFGSSAGDDMLRKFDAAWASAHGSYMSWATAFNERFLSGSRSELPIGEGDNALALEMRQHLANLKQTAEELAAISSLTKDEILMLRRGKCIASHHKLAELSESIRLAHQRSHRTAVETLCTELRSVGYSDATRHRFAALLGIETKSEPDTNPITRDLAEFRRKLKQGKDAA